MLLFPNFVETFKYMIILEILLKPISTKHLELSQSLEAIHNDLESQCAHLSVEKIGQSISFVAIFNTHDDFSDMLTSNEMRVLSGAISMLSKSNSHITTQNGKQRKWKSLGEIGEYYILNKAN
jgi:hypothetical protein